MVWRNTTTVLFKPKLEVVRQEQEYGGEVGRGGGADRGLYTYETAVGQSHRWERNRMKSNRVSVTKYAKPVPSLQISFFRSSLGLCPCPRQAETWLRPHRSYIPLSSLIRSHLLCHSLCVWIDEWEIDCVAITCLNSILSTIFCLIRVCYPLSLPVGVSNVSDLTVQVPTWPSSTH